jgi:hypothetical protein
MSMSDKLFYVKKGNLIDYWGGEVIDGFRDILRGVVCKIYDGKYLVLRCEGQLDEVKLDDILTNYTWEKEVLSEVEEMEAKLIESKIEYAAWKEEMGLI